MHTFKIHAPVNSSEAFIELDGKRLDGVTRIQFEIAAQRPTEINLTVFGYVDVTGEFSESEILKVRREGEHPGMLRARVHRAFHGAFPDMDADRIESLTGSVLRELEREPS